MAKTDKQILNYMYQKRHRKQDRIFQLQKELSQLNRDIMVQEQKILDDKRR